MIEESEGEGGGCLAAIVPQEQIALVTASLFQAGLKNPVREV